MRVYDKAREQCSAELKGIAWRQAYKSKDFGGGGGGGGGGRGGGRQNTNISFLQ
jgi:hypothetical protein